MRFCHILLLSFAIHHGYAQVDTEFWFAPPEVTSGHGDRPILLRISTLDQSSTIRVLQPARANVQIATANIPANTTVSINLTSSIGRLETNVAASVMKTGIRITSSAPVTAYYEVGAPWNSDIFSLKGRNALGNKFVIPGQDLYNNGASFSPRASASFDIVATKDNTVITVKPTRKLFGHEFDSVIMVKLNAGETYSFRKTTFSASDNPIGTVVESNKPIAITIKDDSVINGSCRDLLGDQLVPLAVAGTEYVVLQGFLGTPEYLFITATEDDTKIFIGGNPSPVSILSAGQLYRHQITAKSTYILASKTIYVFHVTGFGCEMGLAILPSINCKGSQQIGFSRTTDEFFGLNILVRKEGIAHFLMNRSAALIPPTAFSAVTGTNDTWYTAQLDFDTYEIPVGQASLISNSAYSFQVGIINGNASSTCRYGYFSAFSTLFIGDDFNICEGDVATLDSGPGKESYLWSTGETTAMIDVSSAGTYWVKVVREECVLYDTIQVGVKKGALDLGPDIAVCPGDPAVIDGKENFKWKWSDGSNGQFLNTTTPGKFWVSVFDYTGCKATDTIQVTLKEIPLADLGADIVKCREADVLRDATFPGATYRWQDGYDEPSRRLKDAGWYWVEVTWNGCSATDSVFVENLPGPPQDSIMGSAVVCPFVEDTDYRVQATPGATYQWFVSGGVPENVTEAAIKVDWSDTNSNATVKALVTDEQGCLGDTISYPVRINEILSPQMPRGPDSICLNKSQQMMYTTSVTNGSVYQWHITGGEITAGQGLAEVVINWSEGLNRLWVDESSVTITSVCQGTSPELSVYVFEDLAAVVLNHVSVDTTTGIAIDLDWRIAHPETVRDDQVFVYRKTQGSGDWQLLDSLPTQAQIYTDGSGFPAEGIYDYYVALTNLCDENLITRIHNTMLLTGEADTATDVIRLRWNHYLGWEHSVERYEVWRKLDHAPGYRYLGAVPGSDNTFSGRVGADGFEHQYIVRALEDTGPNESWSSHLEFKFEHAVKIPNIITPNGDAFNQYLHIPKVELYETSQLTIMDRWGKQVYRAVNYKNDWDGSTLSSGVYFYLLELKKNNKVHKGTISIIR